MVDPSPRLFGRYFQDQSLPLGGDDEERASWFARYARAIYLPVLQRSPGDLEFLEIGCGKGLFLRALHGLGARKLTGIDLSQEDCRIAGAQCPSARIEAVDALSFLRANPRSFDVIVLKAVLEHVPRGEVVDLMVSMKESLRPGGRVVVEVPNMDWLFASHERYMDFTHRLGFTKESLRQLLSLEFHVVSVEPVDHAPFFEDIPWRRKLSRFVLGSLLRWSDPQGGGGPIWSRSLIAVGESSG